MSRNFSLEDVELLRSKAGITYEQAVELLEKYDGDVAKALVELEKRGRLKDGFAQERKQNESFTDWVSRWWGKGVRTRLVITRKDVVFVNLSVLYLLVAAVMAPHLALLSLVLVLLLGCRVSLKRRTHYYDDESIRHMVSSAADNIRESVSSFTGQDAQSEPQRARPEPKPEATQPAESHKPQPVKVEEGKDEDGFDKIIIE